MNTLAKLSAALVIAAASAPALAAPETYSVDPTHTFARFSYDHQGLSTQLSRFNKTTGTVVLDQAAKTGTVDVVIDTTSVDNRLA
ncbi:YceI family protein [uncultured Lamprocystis sp.]|jgi:polyisoprenoid-binding protein YceI|uniref:YceI family protein n=1 Tax=uncultured Lamprocystis sp. TaxID=543132 RepID=UPI0025F13621|nr:YceI family protein [uncultured Lamprocystis sp.]